MILDIVNNLLLHVEVKKKVSTRVGSRISGKGGRGGGSFSDFIPFLFEKEIISGKGGSYV